MAEKKDGRPTKLTDSFLSTLEEVLNNQDTILFTDEMLVEEVNDKLPEGERIHLQTYKNYKTSKHIKNAEDERIGKFLYLLKKSNRTKLSGITHKMYEGEGHWQRFAWMGERMHKHLNLKSVQEIKQKIEVIGFDFTEASKDNE